MYLLTSQKDYYKIINTSLKHHKTFVNYKLTHYAKPHQHTTNTPLTHHPNITNISPNHNHNIMTRCFAGHCFKCLRCVLLTCVIYRMCSSCVFVLLYCRRSRVIVGCFARRFYCFLFCKQRLSQFKYYRWGRRISV